MENSKTGEKNADAKKGCQKERAGIFLRKTTETDINLSLNLDGKGIYDIDTGIPFFNHMLEQFSKHSSFDMKLKAKGDIEIDFHHLIEDAGIVIGNALRELSCDKKGIKRFGFASIPMDEALVQTEARVETSVDFCGRAFFVYNRNEKENRKQQGEYELSSLLKALKQDKNLAASVLKRNKNNDNIDKDKLFQAIIGEMMAEKFFYDYVSIFFDAVSKNALITLHINVMYGFNKHHMVEAIFKSAGIALSDALKIGGNYGIPSTKGSI
ncbi:MAG: imidazoleglycerol-phosphate dehydratase [bacterium]